MGRQISRKWSQVTECLRGVRLATAFVELIDRQPALRERLLQDTDHSLTVGVGCPHRLRRWLGWVVGHSRARLAQRRYEASQPRHARVERGRNERAIGGDGECVLEMR